MTGSIAEVVSADSMEIKDERMSDNAENIDYESTNDDDTISAGPYDSYTIDSDSDPQFFAYYADPETKLISQAELNDLVWDLDFPKRGSELIFEKKEFTSAWNKS